MTPSHSSADLLQSGRNYFFQCNNAESSAILRQTRQSNTNNNLILLEKNKAKHVFGAIKLKKAQVSYKKAKTFFFKKLTLKRALFT